MLGGPLHRGEPGAVGPQHEPVLEDRQLAVPHLVGVVDVRWLVTGGVRSVREGDGQCQEHRGEDRGENGPALRTEGTRQGADHAGRLAAPVDPDGTAGSRLGNSRSMARSVHSPVISRA
ncbi:hypothetical protein GCM10017772_32530 [Promicromonospora soli]|uniref:Uncharacterized protein n=1 Tax=Promicromonospora soli TaxID=2035533 RepID=A0A919G1I8_9MICO|nr:hypothetical protein GCM10017772_32530 [Promicromonospora soli]